MKIILKESGSVPVTLHVPAFIAVRFICHAVKAANFGRGMRAAVKELKKAKKTWGHLVIAEIESADGDGVKIIL
ncbi:MAG TPA: hypothetical protein IAB69_04725 [Candidatus Coproplasma excrementigallinarum]|uniref:Uncharacterized protein n=1 Tax=Candidatus Coproplasma excrementigallinarum TaxID=2840747 RepID=A0A9D1MJZ2_9FIRM|nr:hypothetical protein [Candidatus Coproplasma excrementigallinarum]